MALSRMAIAAFLVLGVASLRADDAAKPTTDIPKPLQGLWKGSWGGGQRGEVVFQPVLAEMVIVGNKIELSGFRNAEKLRGKLRVDSAKKLLWVLPPTADDKAANETEYSYELKGDTLTLTDADKIPVVLHRYPVQQDPMANVSVELITAEGIDDAGNLRVNEITRLRTRLTEAEFYHPESRSLRIKQATVLQVQENSLKKITLQEAKSTLRAGTPVVVAYSEELPPLQQFQNLWKDLGPATSDSEATWQTYVRLLRPGSLIFILPGIEKVPVP